MKSPVVLFAALTAGGAMLSGPALAALRADSPGDVPCKVVTEVAPTYPPKAAREGVVAGKARLALRIDPVGRLDDILVTAYSLREFADEAVIAVGKWKFAPGRVDGDPAFGILEVTFVFDVNRPLANDRIGPRDEAYFEGEKYRFEAVAPSQLDHAPVPVHTVAPVYPSNWAQRGLTGSVVMEFYIDQAGRVRMPAVESTDHPELAWIVFPAIVKWRFEPPTRKGQPVLVRAEQAFAF